MKNKRVSIAQAIARINKITPDNTEVQIKLFHYPQCLTSTKINEETYYMIYLAFPLKKDTKIATGNVFSISQRVETLNRNREQWINTIACMVQQEEDQRKFINGRIQQARRQQWLLGDTSIRIDGKESIKTTFNQGEMGFLF